jgi:hypothetical protein
MRREAPSRVQVCEPLNKIFERWINTARPFIKWFVWDMFLGSFIP